MPESYRIDEFRNVRRRRQPWSPELAGYRFLIGGLLVYPTRQRVAGTFYAAARRRRHTPATANISSTKVAGSGTEEFAVV